MSDDLVKFEVDGQELEARPGSMLIEATDKAGIYIPRFCYHKNLSVAANCRMCLVEVERAPKPLPACATPVMEGMKVFTRSEKAVSGQHATMEFLLINHPLDCPICDQGGECELQDLAMGYGSDVSQFTERKRVVRDKNIGPLVQTDMTRCIHCTRCVRFGEEIAGLRELGATGRGEHMEIGTYVEKAMTSELSGNVIDLCPVGALTNKPYRYSARAWELQQRDGIAPHDGLGSNLHFHVKGQVVKRVVPAENAEINETWLSDRDRYSYLGMNHADRLTTPRMKIDGRWSDCDWDTALDAAAKQIGAIAEKDPTQLAALASPSSTTEEFYLLQRLMRELGSHNVDHRLRQRDFSDQGAEPLYPGIPPLADIEQADAIVLIGSYPRHQHPLVNLRIRKAALRGAAVMTIDTFQRELNYDTAVRKLVAPSRLVAATATLLKAVAGENGKPLEAPYDKMVAAAAAEDDAELQEIARRLAGAERAVLLMGAGVDQHPQRSAVLQLAHATAQTSGAACGFLCAGANAAGAWLAGAVPHRGPVGRVVEQPGMSAAAVSAEGRRAYLLLGVEPDLDSGEAARLCASLDAADCVIAIHGFSHPALEAYADILLPAAVFAENEGSFVNLNGHWQTFEPAVRPQGEARAAWKILRVLGNALNLPGFDAVNCAEITAEIRALAGSVSQTARAVPTLDKGTLEVDRSHIALLSWVPMYACDALVRRSTALAAMPQSGDDSVYLHPDTVADLGLADGQPVALNVAGQAGHGSVVSYEGLAPGVCAVAATEPALAPIAVDGAAVEIVAASGDAAA